MSNFKVIVVIVTFNRLNLLKRCINSLNRQSFKIFDILVINNGSTDETESYLKTNNITYYSQENLGSASGWNTAVQFIKKKKLDYDYLWIMDDDGYPDKYALEKLINFISVNKNYACVSSLVVDETNNNNLVFPLPLLNRLNMPKIFSLKRKYYDHKDILNNYNSIIYPYAQLFNGALVHSKLIEKVGNININYFIFGEEVDFFWRMKSFGQVGTLLNSFHYHPNVGKRPYSEIKIYYYIKNSIINNFKYLDHPYLRSFLNIFILLVRVSNRNSIIYAIMLLFGKNNFLFYKSIIRGFKKELRVDFKK